MPKITRNAFLFFDSDDPDNATCGSCSLHTPDGTCVPLKLSVQPNWSCGAYLAGPYTGAIPSGLYTPDQLGLVKRKPQCQRCRYGGEECGLYTILNARLPAIFDLDTAIDSCDCCNAWTPPSMAAKLFADIIKEQPSVGSVHATTAIGNSGGRRKKRRRPFSVVGDPSVRHDKGADDDDPGLHTGLTKDWSIPLKIIKAQPERQMIFGWASVVQKNGEYIVDKQGDIIPVQELENAVLDYMLHSRDHGVMHEAQGTGRLVMSFLTTPDYMEAFGLTQKDNQVGWIAGYRIEDPALWEAHKSGLLPDFSIGGSSQPFEPADAEVHTVLSQIDKARGRRLPRRPFRWE